MEGKSFTVIVIDNETGEKLLEEKKATAICGCVCNKKIARGVLFTHMTTKTAMACLKTLNQITDKIEDDIAEQMAHQVFEKLKKRGLATKK